ncbi:hypothetical protein T459_34888 [Capsicum annuum]|uniref:Retrotransposon gag domain-containing protein n=1 Tax=Capsicum annuum TaxID=4072 RepID=A0A2G2XUX2_CAPAN|nr:hypothetical protein T459_34888 [Capsicum annuum]
MTKKLRSLELAMKELRGLGGYKSVSYKDPCMFPGVYLPFGFKMPKFEKYDGQGDPVAHLRRYCDQLRGAGGKEELLLAYFNESLSGLASEWFVDQDIDKWISWDDLANEFVQQFQYNVELIPNEKYLTNLKKKSTKTFRELDFRSKPNNEIRKKSRDSFTPIGESYASFFQRLVQQGHSIEDCRALKKYIKKMIQEKSIMVQNIDSEESYSHVDMQTSG